MLTGLPGAGSTHPRRRSRLKSQSWLLGRRAVVKGLPGTGCRWAPPHPLQVGGGSTKAQGSRTSPPRQVYLPSQQTFRAQRTQHAWSRRTWAVAALLTVLVDKRAASSTRELSMVLGQARLPGEPRPR